MKVSAKVARMFMMASIISTGAAYGPSYADDGSLKDAPVPAAREFKFSFNLGISSDYVSRGYSQSAQKPSVAGGVDLTYGIGYFGILASTTNFGKDVYNLVQTNTAIAPVELDIYAGFKPVVGPVTFDIGVIAYTYPGSTDGAGHTFTDTANYVEGKLSGSGEIWKGGTLTGTVFYSPEYQYGTGRVATFEGSIAHQFAEISGVTPAVSALLGYQAGNTSPLYKANFGNGDSNYTYWNAGVTFGFLEKYSLDIRYWDTDLEKNAGGKAYCHGQTFQCSERIMGTLKYTY